MTADTSSDEHDARRLETPAWLPSPTTRRYWALAVLTLLVLDPLTTAAAIGSGVGVEGNVVLAGFVGSGQWLAVVGLKAVAVGAAWAAWCCVPAWDLRRYVPRIAAGFGTVAVVNNLAVLALAGVA